jgi:hypothetical protein
VIIVLIAGVAIVRLSPVNFGSHNRSEYGEYCPTLDLSGWNDFSKEFASLAKDDVASGKMKPGASIIINKWFPGGHLEFYTSRESGLGVAAIGRLDDIHKFAWLNKEREPLHLADDGYAIVPSNLPLNVKEAYADYFETISEPVMITQKRSGGIVRYFYVYRMKNCKRLPERFIK